MQQDAHEFLNYLLNTISETLSDERKNGLKPGSGGAKKPVVTPSGIHETRPSFQPRYEFLVLLYLLRCAQEN